MESKKSILCAFLLNLSFSILEFIGGLFSGSIAIASDALHDLGDSISIGASYFLERKSQRPPDGLYTYGYGRYRVISAAMTTLILLVGSLVIIYHAIARILNPSPVHHNGMLLMAIIGILVNACAAWFTSGGDSVNQKAVNLHMLEDVLGWAVVLIGAIVIRFTNWTMLDPIMSIGVSLFILYHALTHLLEVLDIVLEKVPDSIDAKRILAEISQIPGISNAHHLHIWTLDGRQHCATVHIVSALEPNKSKDAVRQIFANHQISHVTIEADAPNEHCHRRECHISTEVPHVHCHHSH